MRISIMAGAVALACMAAPALAASDAECDALFKKADVNKDGVLSDAEAGRYLAMMRIGSVTEPADRRITAASFMEQCRKDVFKAAAVDPNAPLKGANSFTEGQAADRAMAHGLTDVRGLKKDDDGIWRGTAMLDGKRVAVAIDFKGNVVAAAGANVPTANPAPKR